MEKIYLKDLKKDELENIILNNSDFMSLYGESLYNYYMELQENECKLILGNYYNKYINIYDNYNSFYMKIRDYYNFIDNIDINYLNSEDVELYNKAVELKNKLYNTDFDISKENEEEINGEFEKTCDELLNIIETMLHEYEEYPCSEDIFYYILDNEFYTDYYTDSEKKKIYEDVTKTYI